MTLVYISLLPLHITFSVPLMLTLHWKFVTFSLIQLKHSIGFGKMVSFINSRVIELTVTSLNVLNRFERTDANELFSVLNLQSGNRKVQFQVHYFSSFTLMASLQVLLPIFNYLQMINNASVSASRLNHDLGKMQDWAFNWKMSFKPDPTKQAKEVIFSKKKLLVLILPYFSTIN